MTPRPSAMLALASRRCAMIEARTFHRHARQAAVSALASACLLALIAAPVQAQSNATTQGNSTTQGSSAAQGNSTAQGSAPANTNPTTPCPPASTTNASTTNASTGTSNSSTSTANGAATNAATGTGTSDGGAGFDISGSKPIDISADNGIEWRKQDKVYIARGNALAVQCDQSVSADTLTGFYSNDSNHIDRMTADGNVVIKNAHQTAYGQHADYDTNTKLLIMTGDNLKSVNDKGDVMTARDRMEYWKDRDTVVARGNVYSIHGDTKVRSDLQVGYFHVNTAGKKVLYQMEATGNVQTVTTKQTATSDKMVYNLETKVAVLTGHVKIQQDNNVSTGDRAELNTATNVSRILSQPGTGTGRVHVTIGPKNNNNSSTTGTTPGTTGGASGGTGNNTTKSKNNATGGGTGTGNTTKP
jgi:lipopolysaccharide export system protein LptA